MPQKGKNKKREKERKFSLYAVRAFGRSSKPGFLDSGKNMGVDERVSFTESVLLVLRENSSVSTGKSTSTRIEGENNKTSTLKSVYYPPISIHQIMDKLSRGCRPLFLYLNRYFHTGAYGVL